MSKRGACIFLLFILLYGSVVMNYRVISFTAGKYVLHSDDVSSLGEYILVIPGVGDSVNNRYFKARAAAAERACLLNPPWLIVTSGKKSLPLYDESGRMKEAIRLRGIEHIPFTEDSLSQRTLHTVNFVKRHFKDSKIVVVSQHDHLERILFLSHAAGLNAFGFTAEIKQDFEHIRYYRIREIFARLRCTLDSLLLAVF